MTMIFLCPRPRAQNMFRQAMRSPVIMFHVVPSSMKAHYEQLSQAERNPAYSSGRFSPDSLSGSTVSGADQTPQRMSRRSSQTHPHSHSHAHPDQTDGFPPLPHPAVSAAKPPTGHVHSPQRGLTSTPTGGYSKKVGRRLNIQLKKGERHIWRSYIHTRSTSQLPLGKQIKPLNLNLTSRSSVDQRLDGITLRSLMRRDKRDDLGDSWCLLDPPSL